MNGLIAAAGVCSRPRDLPDERTPVPLDPGGISPLGNPLTTLVPTGIRRLA